MDTQAKKAPKKGTKTKKGGRNGLTGKQSLWLKNYLNPDNPLTFMNKTSSAREAGYQCKNDADYRAVGCQNSTKLSAHIENWLNEEGLGENRLKSLLVEGLTAEETKFFAHEGFVTDQRNVINWAERRQFLALALKVRGMFAPEKHEHKHSLDPWGELVDAVTKANDDDLPNRGNRPIQGQVVEAE